MKKLLRTISICLHVNCKCIYLQNDVLQILTQKRELFKILIYITSHHSSLTVFTVHMCTMENISELRHIYHISIPIHIGSVQGGYEDKRSEC